MSGKTETISNSATPLFHLFPGQGNDANLLIFGQLPARDLLTCRKVCKSWNEQLTKFSKIWEMLFSRDFPDTANQNEKNDYPALARFELACQRNMLGYQGARALYLHQSLHYNDQEYCRVRDLVGEGDKVSTTHTNGWVHLHDIETNLTKSFRASIAGPCIQKVTDKYLYCGTKEQKLHRVVTEKGPFLSSQWSTSLNSPVNFLEKEGDHLYVVTEDSAVRTYNWKTGKLIDTNKYEFPIMAFQVERKKVIEAGVETYQEKFIIANTVPLISTLGIRIYKPQETKPVADISYSQSLSCIRLKQEHLFVGTHSNDESIVVFALNTLSKVMHLGSGVDGGVEDLDIHNQFLFTAGLKGCITIWDWKKREKVNELTIYNRLVIRVSYSKGNLYYAGYSMGAGCFSFKPNVNISQKIIRKLDRVEKSVKDGQVAVSHSIVANELPTAVADELSTIEKNAIFENVWKLPIANQLEAIRKLKEEWEKGTRKAENLFEVLR